MSEAVLRENFMAMIEEVDQLIYVDSTLALDKAFKAYNEAREADLEELEAIAMLKVGSIYVNISEYPQAMDWIAKAMPGLEAYKQWYYLTFAYNSLGNVFFDLGYYETAFSYYHNALKLAEENEYTNRISAAYNNMGEVYKSLGDYEQSLYAYQKSLEFGAAKLDGTDLLSFGITYVNIAEVRYTLGEYELALEYVREGAENLEKYGNEILVCEAYKVYSLIYWKMGRIPEADEYFKKAILIAENKMAYIYMIDILIYYQNMLVELGNYDEALNHLRQAYEISESNELDEKSVLICENFIDIYERLQDESMMLHYYRLYRLHNQRCNVTRKNQIRDGIELRIRAAESKLDSEIDPLTDIPNRRKFKKVLEMSWLKAVNGQTSISFIIIDIDKFKEYNDNYGHHQGDLCLQQIATTLSDTILEEGFLCRYGGDEFVAIVEGDTTEAVYDLAERMRMAIANEAIKHEHSPIADYVTVTLGVSTFWPTPGDEWFHLLEEADHALYIGKRKGRNKVIST